MRILRPIFRLRRYDDLSVSIREHLEEKIDELMDEGLSREEAEQAARRAFGNVALLEERSREAWQWPTAESIFADIRYAVRQLRRSPGYAVVVILTMALGIGANTAIFTLVHEILMRRLPVSDPAQLYRLGDSYDDCCFTNGLENADGRVDIFSWEFYRHLRASAPGFEQLAAMQAGIRRMSVRRPGGHVASMTREFVSGNYFQTFGVQAAVGRLLTDGDDQPGAPAVAVLSYEAWQSSYGGDAAVIGSVFRMEGQPVTIVGVAAPAFFGDRVSEAPPSLWIPLSAEPLLEQSSSVLHQPIASWLFLIGRVRPGVSPAILEQQVSAELRHWMLTQTEYRAHGLRPRVERARVVLAPGGAGIQRLQQETGRKLRFLQAISALLLVTACANVANLMLVRGLRRRLEMSVRLALGSARMRLARQLITESILLGVIGGAAGLIVAYGGTHVILALAFPGASHSTIHAMPSLPVLGFALGLSLFTGIFFGIFPASVAVRREPAEALRGNSRVLGGEAVLTQRGLVVFQAALSLVLLVAAGLFTHSLYNSEHEHFGFRTEHRYVLDIDPQAAGYGSADLAGLYRALEERLKVLPGMHRVGLSLYAPFDDDPWVFGAYLPGHISDASEENNQVLFNRVSPGFLETIGQPVLLGRGIQASDGPGSPLVAVVNEAFVRKFLGSGNPIGRRFGLYEHEDVGAYQVVGVVGDALYGDLRSGSRPMVFEPLAQWQNHLTDPIFVNLEAQTHAISVIVMDYTGSAAELERRVRSEIDTIDPNLPSGGFRTMSEQVGASFTQDRLLARMAMLFGLLALTLTAVGLYGMASYQVAQRTREIGLRMAFGARRGQVIAGISRSALRDTACGLLLGAAASAALAPLVRDQLYGVAAWDPASLAAAAVMLLAVAFLASLQPAFRASAVDPMQALRSE
ncbi:ABC transporter permease [Silvibacterium dinghuense]|uniref:FtsX-like permease family protein n=1 Tax=Silvibacterium dinghuense TaxID=1560006 RepID=A0A4Q1SEB2_9BACT|nr:ABC transporter permease [Silvibacterium dinghuense]RXS95606.1 FtsX-like permease family protein [Silvibacterium dinghuense]GGH14349.1 hypothetical protein GCM10011586_34760 [Silvibacterium dinghuense]